MSIYLQRLNGNVEEFKPTRGKTMASSVLKRKICERDAVEPYRVHIFMPSETVQKRRVSARTVKSVPTFATLPDTPLNLVPVKDTDTIISSENNGFLFIDSTPVVDLVIKSMNTPDKVNVSNIPLPLSNDEVYYFTVDIDESTEKDFTFLFTTERWRHLASYKIIRPTKPLIYAVMPSRVIVKLTPTTIIVDQCSFVPIRFSRKWNINTDWVKKDGGGVMISCEHGRFRHCTDEEKTEFDGKEVTDLTSLPSIRGEMKFTLNFTI